MRRASIQNYIEEKKEIHDHIMVFIENPDCQEKAFNELTEVIDRFQIQENREEFEHFLNLIFYISKYHYREEYFISNINKIIQYYANSIKKSFTNAEIIDIFKGSKLILLLLLKCKIIILDENIFQTFLYEDDIFDTTICHFFYPEMKQIIQNDDITNIENELLSQNPKLFENFEEKREIGQNDSYICSLIRHDSAEEFISYVNQTNMSLSSEIPDSIFETNSFLIENKTSLIEYAAFYGSIQIFKYLQNNHVELKSSLWLFAIHGNKPDIIELLESNNVKPPLNKFESCLIESIKCHHNNCADYIIQNYLDQQLDEINLTQNIIKYHNYSFFSADFKESYTFFYLHLYKYYKLADLLFDYLKGNVRIPLCDAIDKNKTEFIYFLLLKENKIDEYTFQNNKNITRVVIPPSIKKIKYSAFESCTNLTHVLLPPTIEEIGFHAFKYCEKLTYVNVSHSVPVPKLKKIQYAFESIDNEIGDSAFYKCNSLIHITIPPLITIIDSCAFQNCLSLLYLSLPSSLSKIGRGVFCDCKSLRAISIPPSVKIIGRSSFIRCSSLRRIKLSPSINLIAKNTFYQCSSLKTISIPPRVCSIGRYTFLGCTSLEKISIPPKVKIIRPYSFSGCTSLKQVIIPDSVTHIYCCAFNDCSSLEEITLKPDVKIIDDDFTSNTKIIFK